MVRSWIFHGLVTATFGLLGFIAGGSMWAVACALGYFFRAVWQLYGLDTRGLRPCVDVAWAGRGVMGGGSRWAVAWALGYFFREVRQHEVFDTRGVRQWLDRIMDAATPIAVALGFALWM